MQKQSSIESRTDGQTWFSIARSTAITLPRIGKAYLCLQRCAYFGDVSAIRFLLSHGEALESLGDNLGLNVAAFHGHWRLCEFLLENGADVNRTEADTDPPARRHLQGQSPCLRSRYQSPSRPRRRSQPGD
jgi:Ankyrin repeats (3 copies)